MWPMEELQFSALFHVGFVFLILHPQRLWLGPNKPEFYLNRTLMSLPSKLPIYLLHNSLLNDTM